MATWGHRALAAWAILVAVMSPGAGCFKPTIQDGGLLCAGGADGGVCPEGFHCSANGTCRKGPKVTCPPAVAARRADLRARSGHGLRSDLPEPL